MLGNWLWNCFRDERASCIWKEFRKCTAVKEPAGCIPVQFVVFEDSLLGKPYYRFFLILLKRGDNRDPVGNCQKGAEIKSLLATSTHNRLTGSLPRHRSELDRIGERWNVWWQGLLCVWESLGVCTGNECEFRTPGGWFCVCDSLFPWPSVGLFSLSSIWITRHALE